MSEAASVPEHSDLRPAQPRLLYIDDDAALARLVQKDLGRRGWQVVCAGDGDEGVTRLRTEAFDVVALDHFMPVKEGLEVLEEIRAIPGAPPVVYVTGAQEGRVAVAALKAGAADYVIKDVGDDFLALLRAALEDTLEREALKRRREEVEAEVRAARDRAEAMLREVNHRIGNSLQMVSGFIAMQARGLEDESARQALRDAQSRIEAVAHVHRRLYTSDDLGSVELDSYLDGLVHELAGSLAAGTSAPRIVYRGEPLRAPTDRAVSIGVIVAELITNAVKYAYADAQPGEIRVLLRADGPDGGVLVVEDDGSGFNDGPPRGSGLGRKIIQAMAASLRGTLDYDAAHKGVRATLEFRF